MAVLSIQSHVVYGYAGNTAAVFPMQRLGREVWAVNTVEFSNHTGYGAWRGKVLGADLIQDLITGLEERDALKNCEAALSGYLGDRATGKAVLDAVKKVREFSPDALYCCDPVMGDTDRGFYVKDDIPDFFINSLVPLADIITPNQFELTALTGVDIESLDDALKAISIIHEKGPSLALVTSFREKKDESLPELNMIVSDKKEIFKITTPLLPLGGNVAGTGDMCAAVFLSRYLETKNLKKTLELCASSVFSVLEESYRAALLKSQNAEFNRPVELKLIDAQEQLITPSRVFKAEEITFF